MRQVNRWFKDHYGVPVRVIRWEPETQRVIYLREGYEHECFSPLEQFRRKFREIEVGHEHKINRLCMGWLRSVRHEIIQRGNYGPPG
ncbi:DUF4222 domain-containing protein [Escherichia coli]|nr:MULTISPECIES: DUF4222 domain-containing protein [Escherichia]MCJ8414651.1 DUF4222 domain-containing protein [Escherichia coli]MEB6912082.1 DUF4222 domain-containing protein [Escherichia coli]